MRRSSTILHKRSSVLGATPSLTSLSSGEIAINTADGKLFVRTIDNTVKEFINAEQQPFVLNESLSTVNFQYGNDTISGLLAQVLGGIDNDVSGGGSTVLNGSDNDVAADYAFIANGSNNTILNGGDYGAIIGGQDNVLDHENSFIIGSNITSHAPNFTYVNNISATEKIYGDGSNITGINVSGLAGGDLTGTYPNPTIKNSVALYGQPTAPTAAAGTHSTQIATTEFVQHNKGDTYFTTSTSTNTIDGTSPKTFVVSSSSLSYTPTQDVTITWDSNPINYHMHGTVVSYSGYNLVVDVKNHTGNGTHSEWTINVGGFTTQTGVLLQSNNLNDVADASEALTNLGGVSETRSISAGTGLTGGGDLTTDRTISILFGNTYNTAVSGDDPRLSDSRTPTTHNSTHFIGGSDPLTPSDIGAVSNSTLSSLSGNWESTYTTVNTTSSNWDNDLVISYVDNNFLPLSGGTLTGTMVGDVSATGSFYGDGSKLTGIIAGDTEATNLVRSNSANWDSTYTTVNTTSANWDNNLVISYADNTFLSISGGTLTGNLSVLGDLVYVDTSVAVVSTMYIDTNTILDPALRITQRGTGDVIRVEDSANPDSTPFIINSDGLVGIGTSSPNEELTVIGNVSATGFYYGDGSNLTGIVAGDTEATTFVRSNSANWQSTYTTVSSMSATWQTTFQASSAYVSSNPTGITGASALTKLIQITQAGYNSITPASDTLYIIVG